MKLIVLGSGTANPHPKRSSAAFWLETSGGIVMLDLAASAMHRLAQERLEWGKIDAIWISHFHLDHCAGLLPYLFAARHAPEMKDRTKPLKIFGAIGLRDLVGAFDKTAEGKLLQLSFPVDIVEIEHLEKFEILSGVSAIAMKTTHTDNSYAIRIEDAVKSFVYTSDTSFQKGIIAFAKRSNLLIIESSFVENKPTQIHLELAEAMYLIQHAKPERAMLTHFYDDWDNIDFSNEIARFDPICEVIEASDGLRLEI
jgi:ribonuclease Z